MRGTIINIYKRDALLNRLAAGEYGMGDAFGRAYMHSGDPDHAAGAIFGTLVMATVVGEHGHAARANEAIREAVDALIVARRAHSEHRLLSLTEGVITRVLETGDAGFLIDWRDSMASEDLGAEIAHKARLARGA